MPKTAAKKSASEKNRNPLVIVLFILFAVGLGLLVIHWGSKPKPETNPNEPLTLDEVFQCQTDSECVAVSAGCCGCNAGGRSVAINSKYQDYWQSRWTDKCADTMCPAVISKDPSCTAEPKCVDGMCQLN